ncbi:GH116 family glycosyl-hydrolase [Jiangella sp. DSM 45060]|uniref:GH116 family glycosyl-hydrolase n=1 Tax=Jiangella sp. DSM 45060 TaxID=1798224 RepID=UPI00087AB241|nr:GH116 family glycosyl-hydrolase [Jiangella sp. DSM 45060]SDS57727.1 Uncharacterized protein, contains GBA2_N and DUF608 domains [Jiangella sp. DSM 45060]
MPRTIPHAEGRQVAMPLGGIGTGTVALGADGGLRQWQLHHTGNHRGDLPGSFLALRATQWEPPLDELRVLQARPAPGPHAPTPLVTDDAVPEWQAELAARHGFETAEFSATYPSARVALADAAVPLDVTLEALNPLVPMDEDTSSLPVVMLTITLRNTGAYPVHGQLGAALQNAVGYDGVSPIDGVQGAAYGGNTNRVTRGGGWTHVVMENHTLAADHPGAGQLVLAVDDPGAAVLPQWRRPEEFLAFLRRRGLSRPARPDLTPSRPDLHPGARDGFGASPPGATWNGGVAAAFHLEPGATTRLRVLVAWHFPNRYVDFAQFGPQRPEWGPTRFWLGNHYALAHADAADVARTVRTRWDELVERTSAWTGLLAAGALPADAVEHLAAQAAFLRSPSCFRAADGRFFGFEGVNGASTLGHAGDTGGSCPLNCTHVWTYAQVVAALFPGLERSMRETEFDVMQAPDGAIPHRVIVPTYLPQLWDVPIGGPDEPALDGMLGTILKTYREVRATGDVDWLRRYWPRLRRLGEHVRGRWDPSASGVLRGVQPSTHDIDLCGVNPFMGSLWLAALRALEELALLVDEPGYAREHRELFERGSAAYDELLWNGEYYQQLIEPGDDPTFQWATGCLTDQLLGQWWAHQLDLGYVLPREHVVSALRSIVRHNLRHGFDGFEHPYRVFADGDDTGVLMCTWPRGGRPAVPTRYCDEVWTGSEYQLAAACLAEGLDDEGWAVLRGVWGRYDGRRRNPYNEIECGDHYVRAMAGWSVLPALTGARWNAVDATLRLRLPDDGASWPVTLGTAWGRVARTGSDVVLDVLHGAAAVRRLELLAPSGEVVAAADAGPDLAASSAPLVVRLPG